MVDLADGKLGAETSYDLQFAGGALQISVKYAGEQASLALSGSVSAVQLVDALAAKLSSPTEKAILQGLEAIIKAIP